MKTVTRKSTYHINREDDADNTRYRILAVMLSSVPPKTRFARGNGNLDHRLCSLLKDETKPIIKDNFRIHPTYGTSKEIAELLSAHRNYGQMIGIDNEGPNFLYGITDRTHAVAAEVEKLKLIDTEDIKYLKELGKKLLPN